MAMFTLIEINGDHLSDIDIDKEVFGAVLAAVVRNPSNADLLEQYGFHKAVRVVRQSGNPFKGTDSR